MTDFDAIDKLARNIEQHAFKRGFVSAFTLTAFPVSSEDELAVHITRECDGLVYGNAEVGTVEAFKACVKSLDGRVDYIVYDVGLNFDVSDFIGKGPLAPKKSPILPYSDLGVWVDSVRYILLAKIPDLKYKNAVFVGPENVIRLTDTLLARLAVDLTGFVGRLAIHFCDDEHDDEELEGIREEYRNADLIIGAAIYEGVIQKEFLELCEKKPVIIDAGIGTLTPDASEFAMERGFTMIRVDNRAAMAGMLFSLIQSHDLVTTVMGEDIIMGVNVVAGGKIGSPGTIVVDSIDRPSQVIGFADGMGRIRYSPQNDDEKNQLEKVKKAIEENSHND
ncbi:MAG: hypothetical protein NTY09_12020 [bacterium]|nr:hypothetical protein [bacterium]